VIVFENFHFKVFYFPATSYPEHSAYNKPNRAELCEYSKSVTWSGTSFFLAGQSNPIENIK